MAGADDTAGPANEPPAKEDEEASEAGSEDLEAESSGSDEDDEEEEGGEDEDMGEDGESKPEVAVSNGAQEVMQKPHAEVMVH